MPSAIFQMDHTTVELATYAYLRSRKSVVKYVTGLEEKGLISTGPTEMISKGSVPLNGKPKYTILTIRSAVD